MTMRNAAIAMMASISVHIGCAAWNVIENGALRLEISGDGVVGSLVYKPYHATMDHLSDYSMRVRYANVLHETVEYTSSENTYPSLRLFTGYGRDYLSNIYVYSASYMDASNPYLDQTLVLLSRNANVQASFGQYIDPSVLQTETNDVGEYSSGNKLLVYNEAGEQCWIGTVSRSVANQETFKYCIAPPNYVMNTMGTAVSGVISNNVLDAAGASWWDVVTLGQAPYVMYNRLLAAPNKSTAESYANIPDETGRRVKVPHNVAPLKIKFSQFFNKQSKDMIVLKGTVNMAAYAADFTTLNDLDVSIFLGNFFSFQSGDKGAVKIGGKGRKYANKMANPATGVHVLNMKYKKYTLSFSLKITKSSIGGATALAADSPVAKNADMQLPFCMALTGNNPTDPKGGQCYIIARSFPLKYTKKNQKSASGAYVP